MLPNTYTYTNSSDKKLNLKDLTKTLNKLKIELQKLKNPIYNIPETFYTNIKKFDFMKKEKLKNYGKE